jgi:hypothetical protein
MLGKLLMHRTLSTAKRKKAFWLHLLFNFPYSLNLNFQLHPTEPANYRGLLE